MRSFVKIFLLSLALMLGGLLVLALLPVSAFAASATLDALNRQVDETNFVVNRGCSGTLIDREEGLILTANHCVDQQFETVEREEVAKDGTVEKKEVRISIPGSVQQLYFDKDNVETKEVRYRMEIVGRDSGNDLALVKTRSDLPYGGSEAVIACSPPLRGEDVYIVGNPMGDLYSSINKGNVSSLTRTYETIGWADGVTGNRNNTIMQITGGVVGGNSGGAVYNTNNELVGVPVLAHQANEVIAFAVPQPVIAKFLKTTLTTVPLKKAYNRIMGRCDKAKDEPKDDVK